MGQKKRKVQDAIDPQDIARKPIAANRLPREQIPFSQRREIEGNPIEGSA